SIHLHVGYDCVTPVCLEVLDVVTSLWIKIILIPYSALFRLGYMILIEKPHDRLMHHHCVPKYPLLVDVMPYR
ncbi:hypothetical protein ACJX0J_013977, partial [Zea mays]